MGRIDPLPNIRDSVYEVPKRRWWPGTPLARYPTPRQPDSLPYVCSMKGAGSSARHLTTVVTGVPIMATKTMLKQVSNAITGLTSAVSNTFIQSAHDIAAACAEAFGGSLDIETSDITAIQDVCTETASWKGTSAESARRSEIKSIVYAYTGLEIAAKVFKREFGELRREHFVKLARMIPQYVTPTDAALDTVGFFETRGKAGASNRTPAQKLRVHFVGAINNATGDLKTALYKLARKYEIKVS